MSYKLTTNGVLKDNYLMIPADPANTDFQDYLAWVALGNTPEPADPEPPPNPAMVARGDARAWFDAHPNAVLLFNLSTGDLDAEIDNLVDALFPSATAPNKTRMKLLLKTICHSIRALAKREGFT